MSLNYLRPPIIVNGHVMAVLVDTDPTFSQSKGLIGFEIEGGGAVP